MLADAPSPTHCRYMQAASPVIRTRVFDQKASTFIVHIISRIACKNGDSCWWVQLHNSSHL